MHSCNLPVTRHDQIICERESVLLDNRRSKIAKRMYRLRLREGSVWVLLLDFYVVFGCIRRVYLQALWSADFHHNATDLLSVMVACTRPKKTSISMTHDAMNSCFA